MKIKVLITLLAIALGFALYVYAQDDPSGYTNYFGLRMWDDGANPGADSVNQNLIDIDQYLHDRDRRIDSLKNAYTWMFNFPDGTFKRYSSAEFDDDTLKVKSGVFPKIATTNTYTGLNKFTYDKTEFGNGSTGAILNFNLANDLGEVAFTVNNSRNILVYDDDGQTWDFKYPISLNGVPITSGGGDVYLAGRQTFTNRNLFNDSLVSSGYAEFDNLKLTNYISLLGDVTSDLGFVKGSNTRIGTYDNYSLVLGAASDSAIVIDKYNKVTFIDTAKFDRAAIMDSIFARNLNITNAGGAIQWVNGGGSSIYQISNTLYLKQNNFEYQTLSGTGLFTLDSLNGLSLNNITLNYNGNILPYYDSANVAFNNTTNTYTSPQTFNTLYADSIGSAFSGSMVVSTSSEDTLKIMTTEKLKNNSLIFENTDGAKKAVLSTNSSGDLVISTNRAVAITGNLTVTGSVTADSLIGNGKRITGLTRSITSYHAPIISAPSASSTYYWGSRQGIPPVTSEGYARVYFPVNCTITSAIVYLYSGGAGSSQNISYYIRKNATTDYTISTTGQATASAAFNTAVLNGSMSVPISAGDWIEFKMVTPAWSPAPTNIFLHVTLGIE
jgi:hypothetical protein